MNCFNCFITTHKYSLAKKKKMANNKIANKKDSPGEEYNTTTTNMNNITNITIPLLVIILIIDGVKDGGISGDIDYWWCQGWCQGWWCQTPEIQLHHAPGGQVQSIPEILGCRHMAKSPGGFTLFALSGWWIWIWWLPLIRRLTGLSSIAASSPSPDPQMIPSVGAWPPAFAFSWG